MGRSRLPLIALLGAVGCTKQDAADPHGTAPADDASPWRQKGGRLNGGDESAKGSSIRALTPEERASLEPRPVPEGAAAQAAPPAPEPAHTDTPPAEASPPQSPAAPSPSKPDPFDAELRKHGKGSGVKRMKRGEMHQLIRGNDSGTPSPAKKN